MLLKDKVKFTTVNGKGEKHNSTVVICGRTQEELDGRIEKFIERLFIRSQWDGLKVTLR